MNGYESLPDSKLHVLRQISMLPTMGICYMLQYMDKLALSQATLLNLRQDLVSRLRVVFYSPC